MTTLLLRAAALPSLDQAFKAVCLLSLAGIALTAALAPYYAAEHLEWVLGHLE
jgi:hypothetical protein